MIKIEFLGTRGHIEPSSPYHSKYSGILIDNILLFDLGEKEFLNHNPKYIFITHLHPDHFYMINTKSDKDSEEDSGSDFNLEVPIFAPEKSDQYPLKILNKVFTFKNYRITPIPTIHSKLVKSQAYLLEKQGIRILYTGDMIWILKKYQSKFHHLDLVITDGSFIKKGGRINRDKDGTIYGHKGIPGLMHLFKPFTNHIIFTHFGSWYYENMQKEKEKLENMSDEVKIEAAYDGFVVNIKKK